MAKTITAGASRIYRSLALSSNGLAESYAKALEYNGVAVRQCQLFGGKADIAGSQFGWQNALLKSSSSLLKQKEP